MRKQGEGGPKTSACQILGKIESRSINLRGQYCECVGQIRVVMHATNQPYLLKFNAESYPWRAKGASHKVDSKCYVILIQATTKF